MYFFIPNLEIKNTNKEDLNNSVEVALWGCGSVLSVADMTDLLVS